MTKGLWVTSRATMALHNRELRGKSGPTDVISIPNLEFDRPKVLKQEFLDVHDMGDILLCLPVVEKDALKSGESLDSRFQLLVVHSMLHLVGFVHERDEDWEKMQEEEAFFQKLLGERKYFD
jgi:probable rRNA maturation factor